MAHSIPQQKLTTCTAQLDSGKFCNAKSLPDAPFPLCVAHAAQILRYLNSYAPSGLDDRIILSARAFEPQPTEADRLPNRGKGSGFVYYLRVGQHIKIGYSSDLTQRLRQYPPDSVLLAREPGSLSLEARRHREFAQDLRLGNEWFAPSLHLLHHIARVNDAHPMSQQRGPKRSPRQWATDSTGRHVLR